MDQLNDGKKQLRQRVLLILAIAGYIAFFDWMYVHNLYPTYAYLGFDYNLPGTQYLVLAWTLSLLPSLWMPLSISRPSQLAYWVLYITVIIPSMFVPLYAAMNPPAEVSLLMLTLFVGFAIVGVAYLLPLLPIRPAKVSRHLFWGLFGLLAAVLVIWVIVVFRNNFSLVSFLEIYDLRFAADDLMEGSNINYALMWLGGVINPFLMGWGLYYRRFWYVLAGAMGQLLVYVSFGTKGSVTSIVFMLGIYTLLRIHRIPFALTLMGSVALLFLTMVASYILTGENPGPILFLALFVINMRTFGLPGLITGQYYDFFTRNPLTYYSHIKGMSWLLHYPYGNTVGLEVGRFYSGDPTLDATAHFWASDGLAGTGLPGVLFISCLCALVFWALDSLSQKHNPRLVGLLISFQAFNLANINLFTTLLSGGFALLMLIVYVMPGEKPETASNHALLTAGYKLA